MSNYLPTNMKRKDLELDYLDDDGFDFTLSSPARKIRRLDAELPPMIESEQAQRTWQFEQQPFSEFRYLNGGESRSRGVVIEELPPDENEERAIVLFKPINTPLFDSPSNYVVDSDLIASIKENRAWKINSNSSKYVVVEEEEEEQGSKADGQLAVIPWMPAQQMHQVLQPEVSEMEVSEPMDIEEMEATMEAEDNIVDPGFQSEKEVNQPRWSSNESVAAQQWQQQHCIIPQPPYNTSSPVVWYR